MIFTALHLYSGEILPMYVWRVDYEGNICTILGGTGVDCTIQSAGYKGRAWIQHIDWGRSFVVR